LRPTSSLDKSCSAVVLSEYERTAGRGTRRDKLERFCRVSGGSSPHGVAVVCLRPYDWFAMLNNWYRFCYTLWSPFYDLLVRGFAGWRRRSISLVGLQPGERVLIVGAGTGLDLNFIAPGPKITAIDLTAAMLRKLRKRACQQGLDVDARVMDAQAMPFDDASFDVVILHMILAVIPDPVRCAREVARVLRPGGRAVILDKFVADNRRVPLILRLVNPLLRFLGTNATRRLGPILEGTGLRILHQEPAGLRGFFKIVLLGKE